MASSTPTLQIIEDDGDDDEGFDWEAAVREIDVACQTTKPFTLNLTNQVSVSPSTPMNTNTNNANPFFSKTPFTSQQSTLDKFFLKPVSVENPSIGKPFPTFQAKMPNLNNDNHGQLETEEMASCINIDPQAAETWIYPVNIPLRDYQFNITQTALFSNTLVALPTGLGKTLIAAVVMYNYFRWFPEGKIVFAAPSRPLVMQQIEACHNIVGIPQEWAIDMTGQISPTKRACFWKTKRVFFVTPQVLEKDIQSGSCLVKQLVCLVIDEAHRALGNYSYCVAVRELMAIPVQLRILGLTATPGSKKQAIQHIIDNLQISTLEYRNESDHDVIPYVHDRKIELIEVAMGQDAVEINKLLLEVIRPFVARLFTLGVLQHRDFQILSPCDLLNSRDKFRQGPPPGLPHMRYGEVEGYFAVLITLYHIRKLLSSHGIRPAFDMLEEKLQKGSFAGFMCRNEVLLTAKLLMQQSLSHGAPSPKLSKMLEVLIDHFKTKDPQNSRVIIFSNFRGSVRDIMNALAQLGEFVRATEFIGQSSGKALKGQSQKVQQAVLEKFRAGGFNVIVATSIGEEGLDIMEVDLVICFDANVSPLRMIQRMGRTGRKHEGRVVVLACEGSELKGYMRKQANSKAIKKHMRNGGMKSFNFHPSPRMIPHIYKPEVQFVELSIEQFVPRGKKMKVDDAVQAPLFKTKLGNAEIDLIVKYFHPTRENIWRPSLISFPHFQAFPSRVHAIMHSFRTGMLIDTMQRLQGLSFSKDRKTFSLEGKASSNVCSNAKTFEQNENHVKGSERLQSSPTKDLRRQVSKSYLPVETSETEQNMQDFQDKKAPLHSYLFSSDMVYVDACGRVVVVSVPGLPLKEVPVSKCENPSSTVFLTPSNQNSSHHMASPNEHNEVALQMEGILATQSRWRDKDDLLTSGLCDFDTVQEQILAGDGRIFQTPFSRRDLSNEADGITKILNTEKEKIPPLADETSYHSTEIELSPRLANFIKSGVVPESPIDDTNCVSSPKFHTQLLLETSAAEQNGKVDNETGASGRDASEFCGNEAIQTPVLNAKNIAPKGCTSGFPIAEDIQSPLANLSNTSSKGWCLSSAGKTKSIEQKPKFRRLRKYGDTHKGISEVKEGNIGPTRNLPRSEASTRTIAIKHSRGQKKLTKEVQSFIEEEAEVSSEVTVSDDEDDKQDNDSYDDSFIDDRIDPTATSAQSEASRIDMMAIYRRSLLSQSPMERQPATFLNISPDSLVPMSLVNESGSSSGTTNHSLQASQTGLEVACRNSISFHLNPGRTTSEPMQCRNNDGHGEHENKGVTRKRKLSYGRIASVSLRNLETQFLLHSEATDADSSQPHQIKKVETNEDMLDDDQFYEGIDLDAVEEQAAKAARYKAELSMQKRTMMAEPIIRNLDVLGSPSFDLGI